MSKNPDWAFIPAPQWHAMTAEQRAAHKQRLHDWRQRQPDSVAKRELRALSTTSNRAARRHAQMTGETA